MVPRAGSQLNEVPATEDPLFRKTSVAPICAYFDGFVEGGNPEMAPSQATGRCWGRGSTGPSGHFGDLVQQFFAVERFLESVLRAAEHGPFHGGFVQSAGNH